MKDKRKEKMFIKGALVIFIVYYIVSMLDLLGIASFYIYWPVLSPFITVIAIFVSVIALKK